MVQFLHDRNLAVETFQDLKSEEKGKGQAGEGEIQTTDIQQKIFKVNNFTSFHFEINMVWNSMALRKVQKPKNTTKPLQPNHSPCDSDFGPSNRNLLLSCKLSSKHLKVPINSTLHGWKPNQKFSISKPNWLGETTELKSRGFLSLGASELGPLGGLRGLRGLRGRHLHIPLNPTEKSPLRCMSEWRMEPVFLGWSDNQLTGKKAKNVRFKTPQKKKKTANTLSLWATTCWCAFF